MAKKIKYSKDMKECPYCGCEEFYIRQSYSGVCESRFRYDGEEADNSDMHMGARYKDLTKYAYCCYCRKRLFPVSEFYAEE